MSVIRRPGRQPCRLIGAQALRAREMAGGKEEEGGKAGVLTSSVPAWGLIHRLRGGWGKANQKRKGLGDEDSVTLATLPVLSLSYTILITIISESLW